MALAVLACVVSPLSAQVPPALVAAVEHLRAQRSYSWEVINADPGPVAQTVETRRGAKISVQQNFAPHVKGALAANGDMLLKRDWADGMLLETFVAADGQMITRTPEGWLTNQEVLTAIADERINTGSPSLRYLWLRKADRPDVLRPDEELPSIVRASTECDVSGDAYTLRIHFDATARERAGLGSLDIIAIINVRNGVIRDYQLTVQGSRTLARAGLQLPLSDDRFVILTYLPVRKLDVPDEALAKLRPSKSSAR